MSMSDVQIEQYARAEEELGLDGLGHWIGIEDGVVVWVASDHVYMVAQQGKTILWTNDLPLIIPEVLPPATAAKRSEHMATCRGRGRCFSWCKAKRSPRVVQESTEEEGEVV